MSDAIREWVFAWVDRLAASPHPGWWLFVWAFAESSFFPIPPDAALITLGMARPEAAVWYGLVTTAGSVLGGAGGYCIGLYGGRPLLYRLFDRAKVAGVERTYNRYGGWATGIAGLTPLPYKVFTIAGGAFKIDFRTFMAASAVSRGARFLAEGVLLYFFGAPIRDFLYEQFDWVSVVVAAAAVLGFWAVHRIGHRAHRETARGTEG